MDNSLASFAGQAFASSPVKPDANISVSGVSLTIGGPDYSVENLHNVPTQSITKLALRIFQCLKEYLKLLYLLNHQKNNQGIVDQIQYLIHWKYLLPW